jgi:hypothetical protein
MRNDKYELAVEGSVAAGASQPIKDLARMTYQVTGTFNATVRIQGTIDGATWFDLTGDITTPGAAPITDAKGAEWAVQALRVNTTAWVSGAPRCYISGFLAR